MSSMIKDSNTHKVTNKAKKAPEHHSTLSEHFRGFFPLFVNDTMKASILGCVSDLLKAKNE